MLLFSKRDRSVPDVYDYELPQNVRNRILHSLNDCLNRFGQYGINYVLDETTKALLRLNGSLHQKPKYFDGGEPKILEHLELCSAEEFMDWLMLCFQTHWNCGGQETIDVMNQILEEENVGFELTPIQNIDLGHGRYRIVPPGIVKKDEKLLHKEAVKPCLQALSDSRFTTANAELRKAFDEYRRGEYADAITDAGAAYESVMKIICARKKWPYDAGKATCKDLVEICIKHGLVFPFYAPLLTAIGTVRNKLGDAHGKGPSPEFIAKKEHADHMLFLVCTTVVLLIASAKI